jgi:hypothetical protein
MVVMGFGLVALVMTELEFFSVASISFLFFNNDIQKSVASQKCASDAAHGVKGSEFSLVWPNFTDEVWNLPADGITTNGTDETIWHPSKFSDLCASHVNSCHAWRQCDTLSVFDADTLPPHGSLGP